MLPIVTLKTDRLKYTNCKLTKDQGPEGHQEISPRLWVGTRGPSGKPLGPPSANTSTAHSVYKPFADFYTSANFAEPIMHRAAAENLRVVRPSITF